MGCAQQTAADALKGFTEFGNLAESGKAAASPLTDFDIPLYNVRKQQTKSAGT